MAAESMPPLPSRARLLATALLVGVWTAPATLAQPDWVKQAARDAEGLASHRDAEAVALVNTADVVISEDGHATTHVRAAFKILKPSGLSFATCAESVSPHRVVKDLKGWSLSSDGKARTLSKQQVFEEDQAEASTYYDDDRALVAELEDVHAGDMAAFEYDIEEREWTGSYQVFALPSQQPVRFARFSVQIPDGWRLQRAEWRTEGIAYQQQANRYIWTARDLPYEVAEPLMPPGPFTRRITISCTGPAASKNPQFSDWPAAARWYEEVCRDRAVPDATVTASAAQIGGSLTESEEKLRALAAFVQNEIRYVGVEIGNGRWEPRAASTTLRNRYGDCKDKAVLLRAMLQAAGIPSVSVLVNASHPVHPDLPSPWQFDHAIVGIPRQALPGAPPLPNASAGEWLLFDPTNRTTPLGELPDHLQGATALLATRGEDVLLTLPYSPPAACRRRYRAEGQLTAGGKILVRAVVTDFGRWAAESRYEQRTTPKEKMAEAWRERLSVTVPTAALSGFKTGSDADSAWASFDISADRYSIPMGNVMLLKPDIFHAAGPPALTSPERKNPIWFGPAVEVETSLTWHLPDGWTPESDAPPIDSACAGAGISCTAAVSGSTLSVRSLFRSTGRTVPASDYAAAVQVSRNLSAAKGLTILLEKSRSTP